MRHTQYSVIFLVYLSTIYTVDVWHIYFLSSLELVLVTILKLFCTKVVVFNISSGFCIYCTFLPCIVSYVLRYLDVKGDICCLMIFSFYMYWISYIIMAFRWPKLGAETSRCLINIFITVCWLWLEIFWIMWLIQQWGCSI